MRWGTAVCISAVLVAVTSALHLTIEPDLLNNDVDQSSSHSTEENNSGGSKDSSATQPKSDSGTNDDSGTDDNSGENGNGPENDDEGDGMNDSDDENDKPDTGGGSNGDSPENDPEPEVGDGNDSTPEEDSTEITTTLPTTEAPDIELVNTTSGLVRGHVWRDYPHIISYIDIKYGTFRNHFEAPVLAERSETIHDTKDHNKRCPQLQGDIPVGDTDCLTLSIFRSSIAENASVLVHIHEGNFINESADPALYGPEYLISKDLILVLPNYRLGALGFLCQRDNVAPGNAALKDLTLALSWIKANIAKFGGNPDNIAVSADGTAGALAGYLALSPLSKKYVNKVITESGSVLSHWALDRNPLDTARSLTSKIEGFESWQDVETNTLVTAAKDIVLRPCLENRADEEANHFMVETPWEMLQKEQNTVTFMIGSAKYAGVHEALNHTAATIAQLNTDVSLLLPNDLYFSSEEEKIKVANKIKSQYFGEDAIRLNDVGNRAVYYTDVAYLGPGIRAARSLVASGATVYFYEFSFVGKFNRELEAVQKSVDGAVRGDIIGYAFTQDGEMPASDSKEGRMVIQLTALWTTFIKNGRPSGVNVCQWSQLRNVTASEEMWMSIGSETTLEKGLHLSRLNLWTEIYNEHFIERSRAVGISNSVYTVLVLQAVFFISFFKNAWHFF